MIGYFKRLLEWQSGNKTERINLRISKSAKARMDALVSKCAANDYSDLIRRSVALYEGMIEEVEKGGEFVLRHDGDADRVVDLWFDEE